MAELLVQLVKSRFDHQHLLLALRCIVLPEVPGDVEFTINAPIQVQRRSTYMPENLIPATALLWIICHRFLAIVVAVCYSLEYSLLWVHNSIVDCHLSSLIILNKCMILAVIVLKTDVGGCVTLLLSAVIRDSGCFTSRWVLLSGHLSWNQFCLVLLVNVPTGDGRLAAHADSDSNLSP